MECVPSFAPLAERLAAQVAVVRPVEGARDDLAKFLALVMCALLEMLIFVCEALDAQAAAAAREVVVSVTGAATADAVPAPRAERHVRPGATRPAPKVRAMSPLREAPLAKAAAPPTHGIAQFGPWSHDPGPNRAIPAPTRRTRFKTRLCRLPISTPISLRCRN